jgi:hypothetical protein
MRTGSGEKVTKMTKVRGGRSRSEPSVGGAEIPPDVGMTRVEDRRKRDESVA